MSLRRFHVGDLGLGFAFGLGSGLGLGFGFVLLLTCYPAHAQLRHNDPPPQNVVPCWSVPNGVNSTIACANGYFRTITPEGEEYVGMGITDPNETAVGGNFVINPGTGGPNINPNIGPMVRPPYQAPSVAPGQAEAFGNQPRYD